MEVTAFGKTFAEDCCCEYLRVVGRPKLNVWFYYQGAEDAWVLIEISVESVYFLCNRINTNNLLRLFFPLWIWEESLYLITLIYIVQYFLPLTVTLSSNYNINFLYTAITSIWHTSIKMLAILSILEANTLMRLLYLCFFTSNFCDFS